MIIPESEVPEVPDEALDRTRLAELSGHEDDFERELLAVFLASATGDVDRIAAAIEAGDPNELVRAAHGLKGASEQIGANGLATIAADMESHGSSASPGRLVEILVALEREVERVRRDASKVLGSGELACAL
jgi:HPt (histidine-containing phosphotransfer) domain-containing protein